MATTITKETIALAKKAISFALDGKDQVVAFVDDKTKIQVTRIQYRRSRSNDFRITIGPFNYKEREFAKFCRKAKSKLPKFWFPNNTKN